MRVFLAIPLTPHLQQEIAVLQRRLAGALPTIRWSRPQTLHLTLRFFGETPQEDLEKIRVSMLSIASCQPACQVRLQGLGAFPEPRRPRVLWTGLEPVAPLRQLYRHCETALQQAGIPPEPRPFRPHLTLGRWRQAGPDVRQLLAETTGQTFGTLSVRQLIVYRSLLHTTGAEHIPLFTAALAGGFAHSEE
ncbi:MAG: RNA 2',3'-cyclic phosphodiesterase [Desulfuromonadales bacterium]|nr:RNA 2',3'-cyclic phosphodiesterase [Desulfuromonadales bacterium]